MTVREGIPFTTVARTLADLATVVGSAALGRAVEAAERHGRLEVHPVLAVLDGLPRRPGATTLRNLLATPTRGYTRSDVEAGFGALCDRIGMPSSPPMGTS